MASATKVPVDDYNITLTLSSLEAKMLNRLLGCTGTGEDLETLKRKGVTDPDVLKNAESCLWAIYNALREARLSGTDLDEN